jgi:lipoprotein-releasing system ATP-binding protein
LEIAPIIYAKNLKKTYQDLTVLNVGEISILPNIITSIVGPSGAGKSTLLHILGTLLNPTEGELWINEKAVAKLSDNALAEFRNAHLGFVFQQHNLLPEFTALENVSLPAMIKGESSSIYTQRAKELLDFIGLKERYHHKPSQLSGGEQQRVAIARALINDPQIVLADEPTGNLDTKNAEEIHNLFIRLKEEKKYTFLIVTHNPELAKMGDRIVSMKDGQIIDYNSR